MTQYALFYVGDTLFGIDILYLKEINSNTKYTPVPEAAYFIKGLLNVNGQVVTIFDLGKLLEFGATVINKNTKNIILKTAPEANLLREQHNLSQTGDDPIGFIVDKAEDFVLESELVPQASSRKPQASTKIPTKYIEKVYEYGNETLIILNLKEIVTLET